VTPTADGHLLVAGFDVQDCLTIATICGARAVQTFGGYRGCPHE